MCILRLFLALMSKIIKFRTYPSLSPLWTNLIILLILVSVAIRSPRPPGYPSSLKLEFSCHFANLQLCTMPSPSRLLEHLRWTLWNSWDITDECGNSCLDSCVSRTVSHSPHPALYIAGGRAPQKLPC